MMKFFEKVDLTKANYLIKLDNEILINSFYQEKTDKNNNIIDKIIYAKQIKRYLSKQINQKKGIEITYQQKNNEGRLYGLNFSLQSLQGNLRSYLCSDLYNDIDMINSAPSILFYISQKYFNDCSFPFLKNYVKKRNKFLKDNNITKNDVLMLLFNSKITNNNNLLQLDTEIKILQKKIFDTSLFNIDKTKIKKTNLYGSYLCKVLNTLENEIINYAITDYKEVVASLIFDGFLIDKKYPTDNILNDINEKVRNKYSKYIKFIHKEWEIINHVELETNNIISYEECKEKFESKYFKINNPVMYAKNYINQQGEKIMTLLTKSDIDDDSKEFEYHKISDSKKGDGHLSCNFFKEWQKDKNKRQYDYLSFYPKIGEYKFYNMYNGFFNKPSENYNEKTINIFLDHLKLLVNDDDKSYKYLLAWMAQLIQYPEVHLEVCLVIKGLQGSGKDTLVELIEKIIGCDMVFKTSKMDECLGNFNIGLKNKLLILFNEIEGSKSDFANHSKFKDLITLKKVTINEKNKPQYTLNNYARIILFSNSNSPLKVEHSDRRLCVFNTGLPKDTEYYNKLYDHINNNNFISSVHKYLLDYDISDFNFKDRPKTKIYNAMKADNVNEFIYYFYSLINDIKDDKIDNEEDFNYIRKKDIVLLQPEELLENYKSYLKLNDKETSFNIRNYKSIKLDLLNIEGIEQKRVKINNSVGRYYKVDLNQTLQYMQIAFKFEDEDIENWDDEEEIIINKECKKENNKKVKNKNKLNDNSILDFGM